jgi:hypothetical protein
MPPGRGARVREVLTVGAVQLPSRLESPEAN